MKILFLGNGKWVAIDKKINTVVAGIVFKGPPDSENKIEFGAGTLEGFMNRGYMTEVTKLMCVWTQINAPGLRLTAQTKIDNYASHTTLTKCGFSIKKTRRILELGVAEIAKSEF